MNTQDCDGRYYVYYRLFYVEIKPNVYARKVLPRHIPECQVQKYIRRIKDEYTKEIIKEYLP